MWNVMKLNEKTNQNELSLNIVDKKFQLKTSIHFVCNASITIENNDSILNLFK